MTQDLGAAFRALHRKGQPCLMANAWDVGSAKLLKAAGVEALGTTSAGFAFALGEPDGVAVTRDMHLAHAQDLVAATGLPISGDLENGYGDSPEDCAETVRLAAEAGLAGCGIEDTILPGSEAYPFDLAVARIQAAVAAARALPHDFVLTARSDVALYESDGVEEAMRRVRAFAAAGADCVFAPMGAHVAAQRALCAEVACPVNILVLGDYMALGRAGIAALGAARISIGARLAQLSAQMVTDVAGRMLSEGTFLDFEKAMPSGTLNAILTREDAP